MTLLLRPPTPADYDVVASWIPDAKACLRWAGPDVPFPFSARDLPGLLAVQGGESLCFGESGAATLGFGQHWPRPDGTVHLLRIIVSPAGRGRGLGRELCSQLIARARAVSGPRAVTLRVYRDNTVAVVLYESLGFVPVESKCTADSLFMKLPAPAHGPAPNADVKEFIP
jgi:[ribosomal protein S18]-alanine N-acetyltransferase